MARLNLEFEHNDNGCVSDAQCNVGAITPLSHSPDIHPHLLGFKMVATRLQTSRSAFQMGPVAMSSDTDMLVPNSLISQAADLKEIQSSQLLRRTLDLARRAIVDRTEYLEETQLQKSQEIDWVWTHIENLGKHDRDSATQVRRWQLDLCKELGKDNLERHRHLSQETRRRMESLKNRIIDNWNVPPEQILDTEPVAQSYLSRPVLQSLAHLSDEVQLSEAKTLLLDRVDTRVQEEQTVYGRPRKTRGGKAPLGMRLTHADVKGAIEESHKRKASATPEQSSKKLARGRRPLLHLPTVHRHSSEPEAELDEGSGDGETKSKCQPCLDDANDEALGKNEPGGLRPSGIVSKQTRGNVSEIGVGENLDEHDVSLDTFPPMRSL